MIGWKREIIHKQKIQKSIQDSEQGEKCKQCLSSQKVNTHRNWIKMYAQIDQHFENELGWLFKQQTSLPTKRWKERQMYCVSNIEIVSKFATRRWNVAYGMTIYPGHDNKKLVSIGFSRSLVLFSCLRKCVYVGCY